MDESNRDFWDRWPAAVERLLRTHGTPQARAREVANLLLRTVPSAALALCQLDGADAVAPEGQEIEASRLAAAEGEVARVPLDESGRLVGLAAGLSRGLLALGLSSGTPEPTLCALSAALSLASATLSLHLDAEALRAELAETADLAMVGEAMVGLVHSVNNSLNLMVLQAATVQLRVGPELRDDLGVIRREGAQAAARLRPLQNVRGQYRTIQVRGDLNQAVRTTMASSRDLMGRVGLELADDLPLVTGSAAGLRRLVALLLRVALSIHKQEQPLRMHTRRQGQTTELVLSGLHLPGEVPAHLSDLPLDMGGGLEELERVAAESLLKRLGGQLALKKGADDGLMMIATWAS